MKMRCMYEGESRYCRHKEHNERGGSKMRCIVNGCPHYIQNKILENK